MTTTAEPRRSLYQYVRPGMTVTAYDGTPIDVDGVRFVTRLIPIGEDLRIMSCVALSGWRWIGNDYQHTDTCFQSPEGRTKILNDDTRLALKDDLADRAIRIESLHTYSPRLTRTVRIKI